MIIPNYFDSHSHVHFDQFDTDRADVLKRMEKAGIWTIAVGTNLQTSKNAIHLAEKHSNIFSTVGIHPTEVGESFTGTHYEALVQKSKVVAVGECGLDYYRIEENDLAEKKRQEREFRAQIQFAAKHNKPLMLHIRPRSGSTDAHDVAIGILAEMQQQYPGLIRGTAHFFTSTVAVAERYSALGFHISIPGVVTFDSSLEAVVQAVPLDRILAETDAPYATPVPHRGTRNEPFFVIPIIEAIARIKHKTLVDTRTQLFVNTAQLFGIQV